MAYSEIILKDKQGNFAAIDPQTNGLFTRNVGDPLVGMTVITVGLSAMQLTDINIDRTSVDLYVKGASGILLGFDNTLTNANGYRLVAPATSYLNSHYTGQIWGIMASGASGSATTVGVADFG